MTMNKGIKFITRPKAALKLGLTLRLFDKLVESGDFVQPIKIGSGHKSNRWIEGEIDEWIKRKLSHEKEKIDLLKH